MKTISQVTLETLAGYCAEFLIHAVDVEGLCRGIAIANYIETTSGAPRERAEILVRPDRRIEVILGTQNTGQGHETAFPQLLAQWFGVSPAAIALRTGDTAFVTAGGGTHSGRSLRLASLVMHAATSAILDRARRIVAQAASVPYDRAGELLEEAGNSVRTAILMARTGVARDEAERRLAAAGGRISRALHG